MQKHSIVKNVSGEVKEVLFDGQTVHFEPGESKIFESGVAQAVALEGKKDLALVEAETREIVKEVEKEVAEEPVKEEVKAEPKPKKAKKVK